MSNRISVDMVPNPLDIQTLRCSQGDTAERKFQFTLHNQGDAYDISGISDPVFERFKVHKGGTEEILPNALLNGVVDLGTLTWTYNLENGHNNFYTMDIDSVAKRPSSNDAVANLMCLRYTTVARNVLYNGQVLNSICIAQTNGRLWINDDSFTDATAFKNSLNGVLLYYEKSDSTPYTSPILADIQYPSELLEDQYFTYRESPTSKDGRAKIDTLKGNSVGWNQILDNGNFASTSGWYSNIGANTISASANELTVTINTLGANVGIYGTKLSNRVANHKYLFKIDVYTPHATQVRFGNDSDILQRDLSTGWNTVSGIVNNSITSKIVICYITATSAYGFASGETFKIRNYQCFDLTLLNDSRVSDYNTFRQYYPLDWYSFNQGTLINFNGTGIKTVGKNLCDNNSQYHLLINGSGVITANSGADLYYFPTWLSDKLTISVDISRVGDNVVRYGYFNDLPTSVGVTGIRLTTVGAFPQTFTLNQNYRYVAFCFMWPDTSNKADIQIEFGSTATSYEPYTSSITSLPISTYFPSGMKSAGSVYDEQNSKAITRVGRVDLGTLAWTYSSNTGHLYFNGTGIASLAKKPTKASQNANIICPKYDTINENQAYNNLKVGIAITTTGIVRIYDPSYTDASTLRTALNGIYLNYELSSPSEVDVSTASLVCEGGESMLYNKGEYLECECNEEISSESGYRVGKIKVIDADGTNYSNKIQIKVERSPR